MTAIRTAETDEEIVACFPVLHELRPHLEAADFVARVRRQQEAGYRIAYVDGPEGPLAAAGFRFGENLAWGRFLYVDDLVTRPAERSAGHGKALLAWLMERARAEGCDSFHLDSGTHRTDAHRFYRREGLDLSSYHFRRELRPRGPA